MVAKLKRYALLGVGGILGLIVAKKVKELVLSKVGA